MRNYFQQQAMILLLLFLLGVSVGWSALPKKEKMQEDLASLFATRPVRHAAGLRGPLMQQVEPLMIQQARAILDELLPWEKDPSVALLPLRKAVASSEHGIRPNTATVKGLAILVRMAPDEAFSGTFTRERAREQALAMLRYLLRTHGAGEETCVDGKPWGNQWQSAYWATMAGEASWLLWDDLTVVERWLAARMVCDEAERFVGQRPPTQVLEDTRAEENAWNSQILSLAFNFFPEHPRNPLWRSEAIRWILSSFSTRRDIESDTVVDGRPLREWLRDLGPNIHDDFTLENHRRVHPDYMACTYLLTSQLPMYVWGGNPVPEAILHNVPSIVAVLQRLATPDGSLIYPNGQDWGLRRQVEWFEFHAFAAVLLGDATSARLMRLSLDKLRQMAARTPRGAIYLPTETKLSSDQHMMLEYLAHTYVLMAQRGEGVAPMAETQMWKGLAGTQVFASGRFGLVRTETSITTFSWGAQVLGQVLPLQNDLLLAPEMRGLIGHVGVDGVSGETPVVQEVAVKRFDRGLGVVGVITRGGAGVEQRFGYVALSDGRVVYVDVLRLSRAVRPTLLHLATLGVLNDVNWPSHRGARSVYFEGGRHVFYAERAETDANIELTSRWVNLDGVLGVVRLAASGTVNYQPRPTSASGRLEQRFHLNHHSVDQVANKKPGQGIAQGVFVFYPQQNELQTAQAASRCVLVSAPGESPIKLRLEDGLELSIDLASLQVHVSSAQ